MNQPPAAQRIAVVSDTHGHVANTRAAVNMIAQFDVTTVLHCGDVGSADIVRLFHAWPTHFVVGNVDDRQSIGAAVREAGQQFHDRFGDLEIGGVRIALLHSDDARKFRETITGGQYALVCYGHTHQMQEERIGPTLVLNPGAIYRASPHTLAIVELPSLAVTIVPI